MKLLVIGFLLLLAPFNDSYCQNRQIPQKPAVAEKIIRTSDGVELMVRIKGSGPPCLFLHGGPGSGSHWTEKISDGLLERHFRMIYLDQRGVERSSSPEDGNYSLERMVADFEEVRQELGIDSWITMGHSFGGILQAGYAHRHPEVHRGIVMLNCTLNLKETFAESWLPKACEFLGIANLEPYIDENIPIMKRLNKLVAQMKDQDIFWKMAYCSPDNEKIVNSASCEIPNHNYDQGGAILEFREYWGDFKSITADIEVPVLFFSGKTDWMAGPLNFQGVKFPIMMLWESQVGHVAILENRPDLEKALVTYLEKYKF